MATSEITMFALLLVALIFLVTFINDDDEGRFS